MMKSTFMQENYRQSLRVYVISFGLFLLPCNYCIEANTVQFKNISYKK